MSGFKQSPYNKIINVIIPVAIIIIMIVLTTRVSSHVMGIRETRASDFMNIMSISILSPCDEDIVDPNCHRTIAIMSYINSIDNKHVIFYNENLEILYPPYEYGVILDFNGDHVSIGLYIHEHEYGHIQEIIDGTKKYIYFQWVYGNDGMRYLLIYLTNQYNLDFTYLYILSHIVIILVLIFAIKTNFVDHMIFMKILSKGNKSAIDNFKYRKYDS